ncbi:MAG: hypothetical protein A3K19_29175 [Lentisphaerae bacterium RIFOXYB12_FULL_65_16]|nr:MAG: hypothetical protein A3K18_04565 [Lentisphaerae bacterium RIFOXYA12_64_32]OGV88371.1 MAG: hypothetical protein A3K19_29175 [Lentisphaerae bacterium RIFOXYB12_FULL_65_16]
MDGPQSPTERLLASARVRGTPTVAILVIAFGLGFSATVRKSMTVDEFSVLPNGLALLKLGDFSIDAGVPPLAKVLPALPLLAARPVFDPTQLRQHHNSWKYGGQYIEDNRDTFHSHLILGRSVSLACFTLVCLLASLMARRLYGPTAGLIALAFTAFSPNLLAHGSLVTTDIYLTTAVVAFLLCCDRFLCELRTADAGLIGVTLGLACLCKYTGLLFVGVFGIVALLLLRREARKTGDNSTPRTRLALQIAGALAVAWLVICAGYLFQGFGLPLGRYPFGSDAMKTIQGLLPAWLPVPLPQYFVQGIDVQMAERGYSTYVLGRTSEDGFWYYYLVCVLTKLPTATLILAAIAALVDRRVRHRELPLLLTVAVPFVLLSLSGHKNIGMRYLLFGIPALAVWISRIVAAPGWNAPESRRQFRLLATAGTAGLLFANLTIWPDYLAFFNRVCGGPDQGYRYLLDSNLDWGQDLIGLRRFMEKNGIDRVHLAYFGRVKPEFYGIRYDHLGYGPPARYAAVSANLLWGRMYFLNGTDVWPFNEDVFEVMRELVPMTVIGHTIYVYDLARQPASAVRPR